MPSPGESSRPQGSNPPPVLQADSLPAEPPGKPKNTGVGSLSLLQQIFPTQESNQGLLLSLQADSLPPEVSGKPFQGIGSASVLCCSFGVFLTPTTLFRQAPLSMGFPRQEPWSGSSFPPPGGSSQPRDQTQVSYVDRQILYH